MTSLQARPIAFSLLMGIRRSSSGRALRTIPFVNVRIRFSELGLETLLTTARAMRRR